MFVSNQAVHGPIPEGVPAIHDNRVGSPFDVDVANPQDIHSGALLIQHPSRLIRRRRGVRSRPGTAAYAGDHGHG